MLPFQIRADNMLRGGELDSREVLKEFWHWFVLFYKKNQTVFQTNITEINTMEKKMIGIANVNCSSLALTVFLRLPAQKDTVHHAFKRIYC